MDFQFCTNIGCDRLAIVPVISTEIGMVISAISARVGETMNIITTTPMMVNRELSSWDRVCCRVWDTLSMSLVTRLSSSPRGWRSK